MDCIGGNLVIVNGCIAIFICIEGMPFSWWSCIQALHFKKYSTASDVWSYGAVMYEIWSLGHKPFKDYRNTEVCMIMTYRYREWVQRNECHFVLHRWYGWLVKATDFHRLLVVLEQFTSWWFCAGMVVSYTFHPVDHTLKSINPALYALVLSPYACS